MFPKTEIFKIYKSSVEQSVKNEDNSSEEYEKLHYVHSKKLTIVNDIESEKSSSSKASSNSSVNIKEKVEDNKNVKEVNEKVVKTRNKQSIDRSKEIQNSIKSIKQLDKGTTFNHKANYLKNINMKATNQYKFLIHHAKAVEKKKVIKKSIDSTTPKTNKKSKDDNVEKDNALNESKDSIINSNDSDSICNKTNRIINNSIKEGKKVNETSDIMMEKKKLMGKKKRMEYWHNVVKRWFTPAKSDIKALELEIIKMKQQKKRKRKFNFVKLAELSK